MRRQLLSSVAALALAAAIDGTSFAADLPMKSVRPAPAPLPPAWSGWYVGGHIGYGWAKFNGIIDEEDNAWPASERPDGLVGGLHGGYNWQFNTFVFGVEGDVSAAGIGQTSFRIGDGSQPCQDNSVNAACVNTNVHVLASLRARLGWTFDRTMLYVTGGLGYARGEVLASYGTTAFGAKTFDAWGGVAGAGAEWKQSQSFSWRVEGLWYGFDKKVRFGNHDAPPTRFSTLTLKDVWVVRLGATHHF